jgi:nitrogen-specific signal transduction histidine kinase
MSRGFLDQQLVRPFISTRPGGPVIGLSRYRKIVAAPDRRFTVDSQHGKGITVTISLPTRTDHAPC